MSGDEARTDSDGQTIHPALTGRGWCDVCDQPTARWVPRGLGYWRHGWCEERTGPPSAAQIAAYLRGIAGETRARRPPRARA